MGIDDTKIALPFPGRNGSLTVVTPLDASERGALRAELDQLREDYPGAVFRAMSSAEDEKTRRTLQRIREIKRMLGD